MPGHKPQAQDPRKIGLVWKRLYCRNEGITSEYRHEPGYASGKDEFTSADVFAFDSQVGQVSYALAVGGA